MLKVALLLLLGTPWLCVDAAVHLYVSPQGNDANKGLDQAHPLKTLEKARVRLDDPDVSGSDVFVELMAGYHDLSQTLHFTHGYSHTVTFRAFNDQEVHVTGGRRVDSSLFHTVSDTSVLHRLPQESHSKVLQADLKAAGITNLGKLTPWGFYAVRHAGLEVFINGNPLHMAEWPNQGFIDVTGVPDGPRGLRIQYNNSRDARWVGESDPWVYGYWQFSWADEAAGVSHMDTKTHTITVSTKPHYTFKTGHHLDLKLNDQGGYFRVVNMLSELDQPGEYYVDRGSGILYLWPNTQSGKLSPSDLVYVSILDSCIQLDKGVNNIVFHGFTIEACRVFGIGASSVHDLTIQSMEVKNTGSYGIYCSGDCRRVTVSRCEVHHGDGGITMSGGNRISLESSGNVVEDTHIWEFSRVSSVGMNAVSCDGVNNVLRHNHMRNGKYTAVRWSGNDHVLEYNHVHHLCLEASDCGAFHTGRDWTFRGNVVRYNMVYHTLRPTVGAPVRGVMLDDQVSSVTIEHNVFFDNEVHVNIGGGRDNIIRYNVFYNATLQSIQVDSRGVNHANGTMVHNLQAVPYSHPPWSLKYPELANIMQGNPGAPEGNQIYANTHYTEPGVERIHFGGGPRSDWFQVHDEHWSRSTTDYWSPSHMDYRLRCTAADWANGVNFQQPVTLKDVGPRYPTGPKYLHSPGPTNPPSVQPAPCAGTVAPASATPRAPFLPDGSQPSQRLPHLTDSVTAKTGCWLVVNGCPAHPNVNGTFRDSQGEHGGEAECLARAAVQWKSCGSPANNPVFAVYAPTGATTFARQGCFMVDYGCPAHGSRNGGNIGHDSYAEAHEGASTSEANCLRRADAQWRYCGADPDYPITSVFGLTGAVRHAGGGCWLEVNHCPGDSHLPRFFYDAWGATNMDTDHDEGACLQRATHFWQQCGSHAQFPVIAHFRPAGFTKAVP